MQLPRLAAAVILLALLPGCLTVMRLSDADTARVLVDGADPTVMAEDPAAKAEPFFVLAQEPYAPFFASRAGKSYRFDRVFEFRVGTYVFGYPFGRFDIFPEGRVVISGSRSDRLAVKFTELDSGGTLLIAELVESDETGYRSSLTFCTTAQSRLTCVLPYWVADLAEKAYRTEINAARRADLPYRLAPLIEPYGVEPFRAFDTNQSLTVYGRLPLDGLAEVAARVMAVAGDQTVTFDFD